MKLFGFEFKRAEKALTSLDRGWTTIVEPFSGAFEQAVDPLTNDAALRYSAVFACASLISNSLAKLPLWLVGLQGRVWTPTRDDVVSPLLDRPSPHYSRFQWVAYLVNCLMFAGRAYALKEFGPRGNVTALHLLNPRGVETLIADDGSVFYRLSADQYTGLSEAQRTVPARFILPIIINPFTHPLIGTSPLSASINAATAGKAILDRQASVHGKRPQVYGLLQIPATATDAQAAAAREAWKTSTGKDGAGALVLRNGVTFQELSLTAQEAESISALKLSNEDIARAFGVPAYLIGAGPAPTGANSELLMRAFYDTTLQPLMENIELAITEALGLPYGRGVEFDLSGLLRLDTATRWKSKREAIQGGFMAPNEARADEGWLPKTGGDALYLQQQNYSLEALAKRDAKDDPFATAKPAASAPPADPESDPQVESDPEQAPDEKALRDLLTAKCAELEQKLSAISTMVYRGVWSAGEYTKGSVATHDGSAWHANADTKTKPGDAGSDWQLMVKRGKDAK